MAAERVVLAVEVRDSDVGSGDCVLPLLAVMEEAFVLVDVEAADLEAPEEAFVAAAALWVVEAEEDFFEAELDLAFDDVVDEETDSVLACFRAGVVAGSGLARLAVEVDAAGAGEEDDDDLFAVYEEAVDVDVGSFEESIATVPVD